jgi:catechol 2,3-dioxygenase-like lactoylglutathione lyase family enzyme
MMRAAGGYAMIAGGSVTVYVADMERAVRFYTETLGLKLMYRGGPGYAAVDAGKGLELGLHATHPGGPTPGPGSSIQLSLLVTQPIGEVVATLRSRGVKVSDPKSGGGPITLASLGDPDGNPIHLIEYQR